MPAAAILRATLEQRPLQVTDETLEGKRIVNPVETAAAVEKAEALQERFAQWAWEQPLRATRLLAEYNRRFNSLVLRDYSSEGERLTLPGSRRRSRRTPINAPPSPGCSTSRPLDYFTPSGRARPRRW